MNKESIATTDTLSYSNQKQRISAQTQKSGDLVFNGKTTVSKETFQRRRRKNQ